jgi:redox-sensitive bicupin YhaK (pirin superfamily)
VIREVAQIVDAQGRHDKSGIVARRLIPTPELPSADPFRLLEEIGPRDYEPGEAQLEAMEHHQGVDVVTFLMSGELEYTHSRAELGLLEAEDVLWTLAGRGTPYSERLSRRFSERGGHVHGVRFLVDLPEHLENSPPRWLEIAAAQLPWIEVAGPSARTRLLAGEAFGMRSLIAAGADIEAQDWLIDAGADVTIPVPEDHRVLLFVCCETVWVGDEGLGIRNGQLAVLAEGQAVRLRGAASTREPGRLLLLAGKPLDKNAGGRTSQSGVLT